MEKVVEVKDLTKKYNSFEAVKGISFSVEQGEVFGILGPNGAGKTTTLEILEGLKKKTSGKVAVLNLDIDNHTLEIKKQIGVQLQSSGYFDYLSLSELIHLFASFYHQTVDELEILKFVGLEEKAHSLFKNLSGGQKQRFTIATSLVHKPSILFLDEPTTGLDPRARRDVWQLIRQINASGVTVVLTTHYMEEAEFLCNRVAILDRGQIFTINNPKNLIDDISKTTQISFFTSSQIDEQVWKKIPDIEKVYSNYPKVILEITNLASVSKIVELLHNEKIVFSGFTVKTATLEDVYLDLTGREFEG